MENIFVYDLIKYYSEKLQLSCQVFTVQNFADLNYDKIDNLVYKMCLRVGGQLRIIDPTFWNNYPFDRNRTTLIGIWTHNLSLVSNGRNFDTKKIIYILSASTDKNFVDYISNDICLDKDFNNQTSLRKLILDLLENYYEINKEYPNNIIVFCNNDIVGLKQLFKNLDLDIELKLVIIKIDGFLMEFLNEEHVDGDLTTGTCIDILNSELPQFYIHFSLIQQDGSQFSVSLSVFFIFNLKIFNNLFHFILIIN